MKKTVVFVAFTVLIALTVYWQGQNKRGEEILDVVSNNAVSIIEFFPESNQSSDLYTKPPRIHYNVKYQLKGDNLIVLVDNWEFIEGRKNYLEVYKVPLAKIDTNNIKVEKEKYPVGPISYQGEKIVTNPCRIVIATKNNNVELRMFDRGAGPETSLTDKRWFVPNSGGEITYLSRVDIHVPNGQRADKIIRILKEKLE